MALGGIEFLEVVHEPSVIVVYHDGSRYLQDCPRKMVQRLAGNRMPPKHRQLSSRLWMGQSLHANQRFDQWRFRVVEVMNCHSQRGNSAKLEMARIRITIHTVPRLSSKESFQSPHS